ncbi:MAG: metallophosphoesterase family protein [Chloroflexota bacterium]
MPDGQLLHLGDWTSPLAADLLGELALLDGVAGQATHPASPGRALRPHAGGRARRGAAWADPRPPRRRSHHAGARGADVRRERGLAATLFGHSHVPMLERRDDGRPWLLNPGSPTDKRRQPRFTWALAHPRCGPPHRRRAARLRRTDALTRRAPRARRCVREFGDGPPRSPSTRPARIRLTAADEPIRREPLEVRLRTVDVTGTVSPSGSRGSARTRPTPSRPRPWYARASADRPRASRPRTCCSRAYRALWDVGILPASPARPWMT